MENNNKVNIFIAFMLPKKVNDRMQETADGVKAIFLSDGKDERCFHCTLLFIGRVDWSYIPFIQEKMKEIAASQKPIQITIDDIGYFYNPRKDKIKVIYAEASTVPSELDALCSSLYDAIGKPLQGKTTPPIQKARIHFTLTKRLKRRLSCEDFDMLKDEVSPFSIPVTIDNIGLYYCKDSEHVCYREISKHAFG